MRKSTRSSSRLGNALAAALTAGLAGPLWASEDVDALIATATRGQEVTVPALADALLAEGADGCQVWQNALDLRRPGRQLLFSEEAPDELDEVTLARLEGLAAQVPAELERRLPDLDAATWLVAAQVGLDLLALDGDADDIGRCLRLATPHAEHDYATHRPVGRDLSKAVTAMLGRDARAYGMVSWRYGLEHEWLDLYLLRGIGGSRNARALQVMPFMLSAVPALDASVLLEIGNLARIVEVPLNDSAAQRVRMFLTSADTEERKQAAITVGRLDDFAAVQDLIGLLADEDPAVCTNAYWALREITAMTINAEPRRWQMWFDDETAWWAEEAVDLLGYLNHIDSAEVYRAINECAKKRLFRHQLTGPLLPMLEHGNPTVVRAACSAFFALRATEAAPAMVSVLEHGDAEVRAHALAMLRGLTGHELSADAATWRAALTANTRPRAR